MNKLELIVELAKKQDLSKPQSAKIIDMFFDAMTKELCTGGRVEIRGLCAFKVKEYPSYAGRNPKSGEPVTLKGKKLPFWGMSSNGVKNRNSAHGFQHFCFYFKRLRYGFDLPRE